VIDPAHFPNYGIDPTGNNRRLIFFLDSQEKSGELDDEGRELLPLLREWQELVDA